MRFMWRLPTGMIQIALTVLSSLPPDSLTRAVGYGIDLLSAIANSPLLSLAAILIAGAVIASILSGLLELAMYIGGLAGIVTVILWLVHTLIPGVSIL